MGYLGSLSFFNHLEMRDGGMELPALCGWAPSRFPVLPFGNRGLRQALLPANLDEILMQGDHCSALAPKLAFQPSELRFSRQYPLSSGWNGEEHQREPMKPTASGALQNECGDIAAGP